MTQKSAQLLEAYKKKTGMTQQRLADLFEVNRRSIIKYLQGTNIHPRVAERMEKYTRGHLKSEDLIK